MGDTIKYFSPTYPIIGALDHGERLVVDELDSKIRPLLASRTTGLFNSRVVDPRNAQLIFATHDINLFDASLSRRDQIWFTQKGSFGAPELYSLTEYKARSSASFKKEYLMGEYGDVLITGQSERLSDLREEEYGGTNEQT